MKKEVICLTFLLFYISVCFSSNGDSTTLKKNYHTVELCLGVSPKAKSKNVVSSKGSIMYGFWYDYNLKVKNNIYAAFILNPLVGGDRFYDEEYTNNGFSSERYSTSYFLLNLGISIKYKLNLSKTTAKKHNLIFAFGDLFSYKYIFKQSSTNMVTTYSPLFSSTSSYDRNYNLKSNRIRFTTFSTAFPIFFKLSYCKKRITVSLTQYMFTQESIHGYGFFERYYTNFNIGITL